MCDAVKVFCFQMSLNIVRSVIFKEQKCNQVGFDSISMLNKNSNKSSMEYNFTFFIMN